MILQSRRTAIEKKLPLDYTEVFNSQHRLKLKICDRNMSLRDIFFKNPLSKRNFNYSCDFEASRLETLPILPPPFTFSFCSLNPCHLSVPLPILHPGIPLCSVPLLMFPFAWDASFPLHIWPTQTHLFSLSSHLLWELP